MTDVALRPIECPGLDEFLLRPVDLTFRWEGNSLVASGAIECAIVPLRVDSEDFLGFFTVEIGILLDGQPRMERLTGDQQNLFWNHLDELCTARIAAERASQKTDVIASVVSQLRGAQSLVPEIQMELNKDLLQKGEMWVKVQTIPGKSELAVNYITGYAAQLSGYVAATKAWPEPPGVPLNFSEKKVGAPRTAESRRRVLQRNISKAAAFKDSTIRQKLHDAFVQQDVPVPAKKGHKTSPLLWAQVLGVNGHPYNPKHRVIRILKRDLSSR